MRIPVLMLQKISFRSILRNKRRSGITIFTICCGCIALVIFSGYVDYSLWGLRESTIRTRLGHLQILKNKNNETVKNLLKKEEIRRIYSVLADNKDISLFTSKLSLSGIIGDGEKSSIFTGEGIIPEKEELISSSFIEIVSGRLLNNDDKDAAVIAKGLAKKMNTSAGQYLSLFVTTLDGGFNAVDVKIVGIFSTGNKELDDKFIFIPIKTAKSLLYTDDISKIVILLKDTALTDKVAFQLKTAFSKDQMNADILTWKELAEFYYKVKNTYEGMSGFVWLVLGIIVMLSIINTMIMSVFERTREIGTITAFGAEKSDILKLFLFEGLYIGVIGGILGIIGGVIVALLINLSGGIHITPPPGSTREYFVMINIVPITLFRIIAYAVFTSVVASIYPAYRAASLNTVEALRYV